MSMEIPDFLVRKKRCFRDGSYHYSSSTDLDSKNKENISFHSSSILYSKELFLTQCISCSMRWQAMFSHMLGLLTPFI